jgi:hypothetical protein
VLLLKLLLRQTLAKVEGCCFVGAVRSSAWYVLAVTWVKRTTEVSLLLH